MSYSWDRGTIASGVVSSKALQGGKDSDGSLIYVGRALHNGVNLPAKVIPSKKACYVSYNGKEVLVANFEVLSDDKKFAWEPACDGKIVAGAVSTGRDGNDEIYIGRATYQGSMTIGKATDGIEETLIRILAPEPFVEADADGSLIYVGRAMHNGVNLPAKVIPLKKACYVSYNGKEVPVANFEVLCDNRPVTHFQWEPACDGKVVWGAVSTGRDGNDEIYIGRATYRGSMTVGKIHPSHRCLYFPYNGKEERVTNYEVLVYR